MSDRTVLPRLRRRWWVAALAVVALIMGWQAVAPARAAVVTEVIYREIFPLGTYGPNPGPRQNALDEGWRGYWDGMTVDTTPITDNTGLQIFGAGSPNIQPAVNSNPVNSGEGNAFWSPLESRVVIYTEEYSFSTLNLYQITYETNHNNSDDPQQDFPLLKVDGLWYAPDCAFVHTDPDNNTGTWTTATFNVQDITWMQLDIDPATNKATAPGTDCVGTGDFDPPLATGLTFGSLGNTVQAFGLYLPDPESVNVIDPNPGGSSQAPRERFDNYTLIAQYEFADVFVSTTTAGTTDDGLAFGPEDIIQWDGVEWSTWFDGSAAGLTPSGNFKHDVNALWIPDPSGDDAVMSFTQNARAVPGIPGKVDGMDLVYWDGSGFNLVFDGQDVGLTDKTEERIDALHILDGFYAPPEVIEAAGGSCIVYLLVSTQGPGKVPNYSGGTLNFGGEDVLGFCQTDDGATTDGVWHKFIDGSDQDMPRNSTDSISLSEDGNVLYLTTKGTFSVDTATGGHSMVYGYDLVNEEFFGPLFIADDYGLSQKVDGLQVEGSLVPN